MENRSEGKSGLVLALSGGGAAGLAHIGVIQVLAENAILVRAVVGTSIGAEIGAFTASGMPIDELVSLATAFDWKQTLQLFMPDLSTGGLVSGKKIMDFLNTKLGAHTIENLSMGYAAVTTDLETGEQVVVDRGALADAVRASISLPGLIVPHRIGNRWLVDGSVLNPVPFDVARERFGGPVVAVAVHSAMRQPTRRVRPPQSSKLPARVRQFLRRPWMARTQGLEEWLEAQIENYQKAQDKKQWWTTRRVLDQVMAITQAEIVRLRRNVNPPDLMLVPDVGRIGTIEFYRGKEAIAAGRAAARDKLDEIKGLLAAEKNSRM
ncbi:MAG: patatin-like phospholipase family protein [Sulfuricaulis sp.]|nr:patatin-like phospholipase family protein [Sulfuricaulis sp.]